MKKFEMFAADPKTTFAHGFATAAHDGQLRKGTSKPYIAHPVEVGCIASSLTSDSDVICAALLHDVVEDCDISLDTITSVFGERVSEIVAGVSETKLDESGNKIPWRIRKEHTIAGLGTCSDEGILIVCLADKLSNMRSIVSDYKIIGDKLWDRFNEKDPKNIGWYYSSICEGLKASLGNTTQWKELDTMVSQVFPD